MKRVNQIVEKLGLVPHPEGGYYKETYRSIESFHPENLDKSYTGKRNYSTCIYFLLTSSDFSAFHKIKQDEIWHFHEGSSIKLHTISEKGTHKEYLIGNDLLNGQEPQLVVYGNHWFAASVVEKNSYALVSCTVSPGFDFSDFILPTRDQLITKYPEHKQLITEYTQK
ncbi:hypothetical protein GCM10011416_21000 [Polaribacter pacificus]|uniref:DUF985 domain-containing protein n=1 Tax=Polaribacter pacificus TaxID=1775173 RepID=A0A917I163_9FLAO|nr:cupin domain-containing protein [Polaribacter pacificus]GGH02037.1 hypothetical protein GCM10011416_21000 [Polaribacter pacificus]